MDTKASKPNKKHLNNTTPSSKWSRLLMLELKTLIKRQGYSYKSLATELKMSESGFKKLINSEDCSLKKIEMISDIIGIRLVDLFAAIEEQHLKEIDFTRSQEEFFTSKREGFLLYWLLVYERRDLEEAKALLGLDQKKSTFLLRKMDSLNLLKLFAGDRIGLPQPEGIRWSNRSHFVRGLYMKWSHELLNSALRNIGENADNKYFSIRYLKMSKSTWTEYKANIEELEKRTINTAVREMRTQMEDLLHVRWIIAADQMSWAEQELASELKQIKVPKP